MRKYFWKKDNITLKCYTDEYKDLVDEEPDEDDVFLMIHNEEDKYVGYVVLNWMNERGGSTGIYVEINKEYRRRGYGTSAMEVMMEYAFQERRFHKLQGCTKSNVAGAENFVYQLGFKFEALRTEMFIIGGKKETEYYYGMTEEEYRMPDREQYHHKMAPEGYMTQLASSLGETGHDEEYRFTNVDFTEKDECYYCNDLKFRATTMEDNIINNNMLYDSQICRWFDDDVKLPADTSIVSQYSLDHLNYKMDDDRLEFAIEEQGTYIGCVNLCGISKENDRVFASIYLRPECRSKGCGTRAMQFAISYAAKKLNCHNFYTCVSDGNIASAKMMRKLGCKMRGVQREAAFVGGKYVDTVFFEIVG